MNGPPRLSAEILILIFEHLDSATLKNARLACSPLSAVATPKLFGNLRLFTSIESFKLLDNIASSESLRCHVRCLTYVGSLLYGSARFNADPDAEKFGLKAFDHWMREGAGVGLGMNSQSRRQFLQQFSTDELLHHYQCVRRESHNQSTITAALSDWAGDATSVGLPDLARIVSALPRLEHLAFDTSFFQSGQGRNHPCDSEHVLSRPQLAQMHRIVQDTLQNPLDWGCASGYLQVFAHLVAAVQHARRPISHLTITGLQNPGFLTLIERSAALKHMAASLTSLTLILPPSLLFIPYIPRYHIALFLANLPALRNLTIDGATSSSSSTSPSDNSDNDTDDDDWRDDCRTGHSLDELFNAVSLPALRYLKLRGLVVARNALALLHDTAPYLTSLSLSNLQGPIDHTNRVLPSTAGGATWPGILADLPHQLPLLKNLELAGCLLTGNADVSVDFRDNFLRAQRIKHPAAWRKRLTTEILEEVTMNPGGILEDGQWPWERMDLALDDTQGTHW